MKRLLILPLLMFIITASFAANITKEYDYTSFSSVTLKGSTDVYISPTNGTASIKTIGPQELMDKMQITLEGDNLIITHKGSLRTNANYNVKVYIAVPQLHGINLKGSGDIYIADGVKWSAKTDILLSSSGDLTTGNIACEELNLSIKSSGDVKFADITARHVLFEITSSGDIEAKNIDSKTFESYIKGSGDIDIKKITTTTLTIANKKSGDTKIKEGTTDIAFYTVTGSGDIKAKNVLANSIEATITGSGDVNCHANKSIKGKVTSSGKVYYNGTPELVDISKKGFKSN